MPLLVFSVTPHATNKMVLFGEIFAARRNGELWPGENPFIPPSLVGLGCIGLPWLLGSPLVHSGSSLWGVLMAKTWHLAEERPILTPKLADMVRRQNR